MLFLRLHLLGLYAVLLGHPGHAWAIWSGTYLAAVERLLGPSWREQS